MTRLAPTVGAPLRPSLPLRRLPTGILERLGAFRRLGLGWARSLATALLCGVLAACGGGGGGDIALPVAPGQAPTLIIRSDVAGEVRANFNVQFFFSAPVVFPGGGDLAFALSGARIVPGTFRQLAPDTWQITLSPDVNKEGVIDLRVPAGAYADATSGERNAVAYDFAQPFDTRAPYAQLEFTGPLNFLGMISGPGTFTMRFQSVLDAPLAADKLVASAGTVTQFRKTSGPGEKDVYTFSFAPPAASFGGMVFELPAGSVSTAGIPNLRETWNFTIDTR